LKLLKLRNQLKKNKNKIIQESKLESEKLYNKSIMF
jgi:hypothetical protein